MSQKRRVDTNIYERNYTYYFVTYNGYDKDGKKIRKYGKWIGDKKKSVNWNDMQAKKEYHKFYSLNNKYRYLRQNLTFDTLYKEYIYMYANSRLKVNTKNKYIYMIDKYLIDYLKDKKISDINIVDLNKYINELNTTRNNKIILISVIKSIYKYAYTSGYIEVNATMYLYLDKEFNQVEHQEDKTKITNIEYLDITDITDITKYFNKQKTIDYVVNTLIYTGIRIGECLALNWNDIDLKKGTININKTLVYTNNEYIIQAPKTQRSKRKVYMCNELIKLLRKYHEEEKKKYKTDKESIVFHTNTNKYLNYTNVNKSFKRRLKDTKYNKLHIHSLRHIYTTMLLNNNTDITKVSMILGHSNKNTTLNIYQDIIENDVRNINENLC